MADQLVPNYRRRTKLQQPNYTRARAAYRSPLNSERMNLAAEQLRFDLTNLRVQTDQLKAVLDQQLDITTAVPVVRTDVSDPSYVSFSGTTGNYLSTPDATALDVLSDLTIVTRIALDDWTPDVNSIIAMKGSSFTHGGMAYGLLILTTGLLQLYWDSAAALNNAISTANLSTLPPFSWKWIAVTLDVISGANREIRFWTSDNGTTWTILGAPVITAGVTDIVNNTEALTIGGRSTAGAQIDGKISHVSIRNAIGAGGTVPAGNEVFRFDANANITNVNATTFTATTGQIITVNKAVGVADDDPPTLVDNTTNVLLAIPSIAAKVRSLRERVRLLEIAKGINS